MTRLKKYLIGGAVALLAAAALAQTATRFAAIRVDNLTNNRVIIGGGTSQLTPLPAGTTTTVLHGDATGTPAYAAVSLTTDISGTLGAGNGGLGITTTTDDTLPLANGSGWVATAVPNCVDTGGNHLNYTAATNAISCGTSGGGGSTTGTFTATFATGCSANNTQTYAWTLTSGAVTLTSTQNILCTSNGITMATAAGDLPAAIRPARQVQLQINRVQDNGANDATPGCLILDTNGTISINRTAAANPLCSGAAFTNSGTKGFVATYGNFNYSTN